MAYSYKIIYDKNKVTVGMVRRAARGEQDGMVDIIAALSVDDAGARPPHQDAITAIDETMSWEEYEEARESITEMINPKAR